MYDIYFWERLYVCWYPSIWELLEINTNGIDSIELQYCFYVCQRKSIISYDKCFITSRVFIVWMEIYGV